MDTIKDFASRRKATRNVAKTATVNLEQYLADILPLIRHNGPVTCLISNTRSTNQSPSIAKVINDFLAAARTVTNTQPFQSVDDVILPIEITSWKLTVCPFHYTHEVPADHKPPTSLAVITPMKWIVAFETCPLDGLKVLLTQREYSSSLLKPFVDHYVLLSIAMHQPGVQRVLEGLGYTTEISVMPAFGALPVTTVHYKVPTIRPSDSVILDLIDISGVDRIEEVIDYESIHGVRDPLREQLDAILADTNQGT